MNKDTALHLAAVALLAAFSLTASGCGASVPKSFDEVDALPAIYPDYIETTFPPNIAPANFRIEEEGTKYAARVSGSNGRALCVSGPNAVFPAKGWRKLLEANRGGALTVDVFVKRDGKWLKFKSFTNQVANEPADPYLAYRLIEPGYDYGHRILLAQRCVENYDERFFFDNRCTAGSPCANCHSFQDHKTDRFLFHFRRPTDPGYGGTIIVDGKEASKVTAKTASDNNACTYPAWRPTGDLVAFSSNLTRQSFHSLSTQKIEVYDAFSDLVLYDVAKNELKVIEETNDDLETFPFWSPDGAWLYYCSAKSHLTIPKSSVDARVEEALKHATEVRYDVYRRSFDESTRTFGPAELVVDASSKGRSALFPRISPDGKFLLYTLAESGTFPIWRPEADLYLLNLETGEDRAWSEVNGDDSDSYHSWHSNGSWVVFSSRREDGQYTRLYLTHVDPDGRASKPFVLPQKDPEHNRRRFKSYNVPETLVEPIKIDFRDIVDAANSTPEETRNL